jgi:general nucleoside transport system permease protein
MSEAVPPVSAGPPPGPPSGAPLGFVARYALLQRAGGVTTALITALIAFLIGGLVVLATGHNPLSAYHQIFDGTGLNWLFPWVTGQDRTSAAFNLQQTMILATPLMLTGLAVAFAFRCGLFNIGGQGQYVVGSIVSVWIASSWAGMNGPLHVVLTIVIAALAGGAYAAVAGLLKATVGAHEVISTIMLNWIAYWTGSYLFGLGGPLQNKTQKAVPISNDIVPNTHLHVFWGDPLFQGLHIGFFVALAALVTYWLVLSRTTLGFEVRAVGFNPDAARYGGISVARNYITAMAISGSFAAVAGALDILGWRFRLGELDIQTSNIGFTGIAVALLGRNTAVGVFFGAVLFGGLINGTSGRHLSADVFPPQLAGNLTLIIQGLIILFIAADVLVLYLWRQRKRLKPGRRSETAARAAA